MTLINDLLNTLPDREVSEVIIGLHWTAVVTGVKEGRYCGLATTYSEPHDHHEAADVPNAGELETVNGLVLATNAQSDRPVMRSVGIATINSLLIPNDLNLVDQNAEQAIAAHGEGKKVVLVGRFPFVPSLRKTIRDLTILEIHPHPGEVPASSAQDVVPAADVVAITGMSLINHTFEDLLNLCPPEAYVIVLGPSAPLSPVLFDYGVNLICGSLVTKIAPVLRAVRQGANFRQVHRVGVRLISMAREDNKDQ
jgi:uncharacterized protein (DUF4213/DUF364 family)